LGFLICLEQRALGGLYKYSSYGRQNFSGKGVETSEEAHKEFGVGEAIWSEFAGKNPTFIVSVDCKF